MRIESVVCCLVSFSLLSFSACSQSQKMPASSVLAKVNGAVITEDDLYLLFPEGHGGEKTPEMRAKALDRLIEQELLYQQGLKLGLDKDPKYRNLIAVLEARLNNLKRSEMARRVTSTRITAAVDVNQEDAARYYEQNKGMITEDLHLLILRFPAEEEAKSAHQKIVSGTDFQVLAQEVYSAVPKGRDIPWDPGFLHWDQIPFEWAEAVYALRDGEISGVLGTNRTGWCIVKLAARRKNPDAALAGMNASIANRLRDLRIAEAYERYMQDLKKSSRIVKYEERRNSS